jgi:excisionase family DNA binding protein
MPNPSKIHQFAHVPWQKRAALSVTQAAEILSLSRRHAYEMVAAGHIRAVRIGGRRVIIPVDEIHRLLKSA